MADTPEISIGHVVDSLVMMAQSRDVFAGDHSREVESVALELGASLSLGRADLTALSVAARLHDVGRIAIPDSILWKVGPLTENEWNIVQEHPVIGARIVSCVPALGFVAPIVEALHERWDGRGYPHGMVGLQIPLAARVIAVADAYCTMVSDRPHKKGVPEEKAVFEVRDCSGSQFDPTVVGSFIRWMSRRHNLDAA